MYALKSVSRVVGLRVPLAGSPWPDWKALMAFWVFLPWTPSMGPGSWPSFSSMYCTGRPFQSSSPSGCEYRSSQVAVSRTSVACTERARRPDSFLL
jgi:hypothetical protein